MIKGRLSNAPGINYPYFAKIFKYFVVKIESVEKIK